MPQAYSSRYWRATAAVVGICAIAATQGTAFASDIPSDQAPPAQSQTTSEQPQSTADSAQSGTEQSQSGSLDSPAPQSRAPEEEPSIIEPMNFAVNLAAGTATEKLEALAQKLDDAGNRVLAQYPQFSTFFVQSNHPEFSVEVQQAASDLGITLDTVGPTRQAAVTGDELLVEAPPTPQLRTLRNVVSTTVSQLDREAALSDFEPDPLTPNNVWGVQAIGALEAQTVDVPLEPVTVAVLDTGIDGTHPDLVGQIDEERSVGCDANGIADTSWEAWQDNHYHGTHVAGTIAAAHNGEGVDGVAPEATLVAVRTGNADGFFYPEYVTCAFAWAAEHDIDVTNNSYYVDPWAFWVPTEENQAAGYEAVRRAVEYSYNNGVVNVAAAGNSDYDLSNPTTDDESPNDLGDDGYISGRDVTNGLDLPAQLPHVVSVSSVASPGFNADEPVDFLTEPLIRSTFSNYGLDAITVAAPGSNIASTIPASYGGGYAFLSGTSMASPHVAGVAALIKAIHPNYSPEQTIALLEQQANYTYDRLAEPTDGKEYRGSGLTNAYAAVTTDQPRPSVASLEYSTDGGASWKPLEEGTKLSGKVSIRATIAGPVTFAKLSVSQTALAEAEATGAFDESVTLVAEVDYSDLTSTASEDIVIVAEGRNNDPAADDDITVTYSFEIVPVAAPPTGPEEPAEPAPKKDSLASTGASVSILAGAAIALTLGSGLVLSRRLKKI